MIDWTKPIRQKNGRRAVFLERGINILDIPSVILFAVKNTNGNWAIVEYQSDGSFKSPYRSEIDLENIPEEIPMTANPYSRKVVGFECLECGQIFEENQFGSHMRLAHAPDCNGGCALCPIGIQCGPVEAIHG